MTARQRVAVVTGGGGGIGAAIAEALGRAGAFVVTMDPLVTLDGAEVLPPAEETTAGRIVAAGGSARASSVSVTDGAGVQALFAELVAEHGAVDAVVNVAGITRPTGFAKGSEDDWRSVLEVHLDGWRNVLAAALPIMAAAGHGRILGVTSGSGWRPADTGAYGCAKRAVASLTWQLGRAAPPGVTINAISPIAVTRMVTAALGRAPQVAAPGGSSATGGLSLGSMPEPSDLGPLGAHLVSEGLDWCSGQVIFTGGSEVAVVREPQLLEVIRTESAASLAHLLDIVTAGALVPAEEAQATTGGSNPRFPGAHDEVPGDVPPSVVRTAAVVTDRPETAGPIIAALEARGVTCQSIVGADAGALPAVDGVVLALDGSSARDASAGWERILAEHVGIVEQIHRDAAWARAVADLATAERPIRLVTLTDATTAGGRSRAQAAAQQARASRRATKDAVAAFAVSVEAESEATAELAAHLLASEATPPLSGAELVVGDGWFGLRSHPHPSGSLTLGGAELPRWFDDALRQVIGLAPR